MYGTGKNMIKKIAAVSLICCLIPALLLGGCSSGEETTDEQSLTVTRGDLDITVSTNGSLTMPDDFNLRFGTTGKVKEILVEEGDTVKQGAILAFLDNTSQKNAIRTALYNLRNAINASAGEIVTETGADSGTCDDGYYFTFPDLSAPRMAIEAEDSLKQFIDYYDQGLYKDAGGELAMAYLSLDVCEDLIAAKIDPDIISGKKDDSVYFPDIAAGTDTVNEGTNRSDAYQYTEALTYLKTYRQKLLDISNLIKNGELEQARDEAENVLLEMKTVYKLVENTVTQRGLDYFTFTDIPTSLNFLQSAIRSIQDLNDYLAQEDTAADTITKELYLAKLNLSIARNAMENQEIKYWIVYGWKGLQQYNLSVQSSEIALEKAIQDIKNTVIIAPSDGTVVSLGLKKDYILSAQDYSSKVAVELVDTKSIKFTGQVDEIDILKVQKGQIANITVDAVPDTVFKGKVKFISPYGVKDGQVVKFDITIELDPTDTELRGGLSASADIQVYKASNVLLVPVSALSPTVQGYTVTVINSAGQPEVRQVEIGQQNFQYAEVLSGLKEGDKVLPAVQKPSSLSTGFGPPPGR